MYHSQYIFVVFMLQIYLKALKVHTNLSQFFENWTSKTQDQSFVYWIQRIILLLFCSFHSIFISSLFGWLVFLSSSCSRFRSVVSCSFCFLIGSIANNKQTHTHTRTNLIHTSKPIMLLQRICYTGLWWMEFYSEFCCRCMIIRRENLPWNRIHESNCKNQIRKLS